MNTDYLVELDDDKKIAKVSLDGLNSSKIAKMIDHSLLHPGLTDKELEQECAVAVQYNVGAVCVKPYHTRRAVQLVSGSDVKVSAVIAFPHGNSSTQVKLAECHQVLEDGALEVDMVINIAKALSGDWDYIEREIREINALTVSHNAILKVIFENDLLTSDQQKIMLCRICSKYKVAFVKTSTGYNFNKTPDGKYNYQGATHHDLKLMRAYSDPEVQVKAAGAVSTLEPVLAAYELGATRFGLKNAKQVVEDAIVRFGS